MSPETLYTMGGKGGKQSVDQPRNTNLGCSFYPLGRDCGFNKAGGGTCGTKLPGTGEWQCPLQTPTTSTLEGPVVTKSGLLTSVSFSQWP